MVIGIFLCLSRKTKDIAGVAAYSIYKGYIFLNSSNTFFQSVIYITGLKRKYMDTFFPFS